MFTQPGDLTDDAVAETLLRGWSLIDEDSETAVYCISTSGRSLNNDALRLYRLWWDLCEVSHCAMGRFLVPSFCRPCTASKAS